MAAPARKDAISPIRGPLILLGIAMVGGISGLPSSGMMWRAQGSLVPSWHYGDVVSDLCILVPLACLSLAALGLPVVPTILGKGRRVRLTLLALAFGVAGAWVASAAAGRVLEGMLPAFDQRIAMRPQVSSMTVDTTAERVWLFLWLVLAVPISEELIFRGLAQNLLARCWRPWPAILVTSLVFGLFYGNLQQILEGVLLGLILGYVFHKTRSLLAPILIHGANNLLALLAWSHPQWGEVLDTGSALAWITGAGILAGWGMLREARRAGEEGETWILPQRMRWEKLLAPMIPFAVMACILAYPSERLAGDTARHFVLGTSLLTQSNERQLAHPGHSDPYRFEVRRLLSRCRREGKRGRLTVEDYREWAAQAARKWGTGTEETWPPKVVLEETASEGERETLREIRADVREHLRVEPPPLDPWSLEHGLGGG